MGLFGLFSGSGMKNIKPVDWAKNEEGHFHRFGKLDPDALPEIVPPIIYILWHGGEKPGWVYIGISEDLKTDFKDIRQNREITRFHANGGLLITWADFQKHEIPGCFAFLNDILMPEITDANADLYRDDEPIRILPPGYDKTAFIQAFES